MVSFIEASDWAHVNFDKITYERTLAAYSGAAVLIRFVDIFEHRGRKLHHERLMHVEVGPQTSFGGLLSRIYLEGKSVQLHFCRLKRYCCDALTTSSNLINA